MEISLTYYFTILCVTIFLHLEAKPFSLNQAIAENLKRKHFETLPDISTEEYSSSENTIGSSLATKKLKDLRTLLGKANIKIPVLNYSKKLQFKKPTKLDVNNKKLHFKKPTNLEVKPKHNQKQGIKRQVEDDYGINKKYLPLLRSISMLFDDILSPNNVSGESESFISNRGEFACTCSRKSKDLQPSQSRPQKKTIVAPETVPTETSPPIETVTPAEKVYHITPSSKRSFRQNKILPVLFPRNTTSNRGNYNGLRKRGSPARLGNIARNISRNRGNSKYDSRKRKDKAIPANDQENPNGDSRDNASFKFGRGISRNGTRGGDPAPTEVKEVTESAKSESSENTRGPLSELERENSVEIGGDQTESPVYAGGDETKGPIYDPRLGRRSRGFTTKSKESNSKKSLQSKKYSEKSFDNVALNNASVERKLIRASGSAEEDQIISSTDAPARVTRDILVPYSVTETSPRNKSAIVMIIDGYSIARDKNGKRTLSKQHFNDDI